MSIPWRIQVDSALRAGSLRAARGLRGSGPILALLGMLALVASSLPAQDAPSSPPAAEVGVESDAVGSVPPEAAVTASDPLPTPSFQRAYWHLFIAFGVAWSLLLGYAVLLDRRVDRARQELRRMEGE